MGRRASHQLPQTAYCTDCSPDPAIQVTLSCLNKTVLFMIDNTTAVAYLSRQARRDTVPLPPQAAHIAGEGNVLVDMASRVGPTIPTEWTLTTREYQWICSRSRGAHRHCNYSQTKPTTSLPKHVFPCQNVKAWATDAVQCRWPDTHSRRSI